MPNYAYCECRSNDSYDLSVLGQPFQVSVEYDNSSGADAWVHLGGPPFGDRPAVQVPPGNANSPVTFDLPNMAGDTTNVTLRARLRDTNDPAAGVGTSLYIDEEQTGIAFYGLGMFEKQPVLEVAPGDGVAALAKALGTVYCKRFAPRFPSPFFATVRVLVYGKPAGKSPVLYYDLTGFPTRWERVHGKWALDYSFLAPNPPAVGAGERVFAVALLLDLGGKIKDQTRFSL